MKHIQKTRAGKKLLLLIILAAVFVLLLAGYFIARALTPEKNDDPTPAAPPEVDTEIGELVLYNTPVAYAQIGGEAIDFLTISHPAGDVPVTDYGFLRDPDSKDLILFYYNENGDAEIYAPAIVTEDTNFSYSSLYATEAYGDYGNIPKVTYLLTGLGTVYFEQRIRLEADGEERYSTLKRFGLDAGHAVTVYFTYEKEDGTSAYHTLRIGDRALSGSGFYYTVDDRDYIYYTTNNYFSYATAAIESYINPRVIAEGLASDNAFEPYLTPRFEQYVNTLCEKAGELLPEGAETVVRARVFTPGDGTDGYHVEQSSLHTFYLDGRAGDVLTGRAIGSYDDPIYLTFTSKTKLIDLPDEGKTIKYDLAAIEAILTDGGEIRTPGTAVGENTRLLITYNQTVDGVSDPQTMHAVLDLDDPAIPVEAKTALKAAAVGVCTVSFTVNYEKETAKRRTAEILLSEIISIYSPNGEKADFASDGCFVRFSYYVVTDGVRSEQLHYASAEIGDEDAGEYESAISSALAGQTVGADKNVVLYSYTGYVECLEEFTTYEIGEILRFITSKQVVAFRYVNASERDPYYGETFYKNTMSGSYALYGLNTSSCEAVVRMLGGLGESSTASIGITGYETVAVGLSEEVFERYGLYANTVVFSLPRGISVKRGDASGGSDSLDDYTYNGVLTFTLRISDKVYDAEQGKFCRYVSSDLFNLVAKADADDFLFLEYDFETFYARTALIMMDIDNVDDVTVDFRLEDLSGKYEFDLRHNKRYYVVNADGSVTTYENASDAPSGTSLSQWDFADVIVTPGGVGTKTKLTERLAAEGYDYISLREFYGSRNFEGLDSLGTSLFKEVFQMIYSTSYAGQLTEEDRAMIGGDPLFTLTLGVVGQENDKYVYEFFRVSDRRVAVRLSQVSAASGTKLGEVAAFYVSSFTYKRYLSAFLAILNGEIYRSDNVYPVD